MNSDEFVCGDCAPSGDNITNLIDRLRAVPRSNLIVARDAVCGFFFSPRAIFVMASPF